MKDLSEFLPQILPFAPGCPVPTAYSHIRGAAITFSERTRLWRYLDEFNVTPTSCNVTCAPEGSVVFEIESARIDGMPLEPTSLSQLDYIWPNWRDAEGIGQYIVQEEPDSVIVVPAATGSVSLSLFLKPSEDAEQLPDFMVDKYRRTIAAGALSMILALPKQSFTDPSLAMFHGNKFEADLNRLSTQNIRGQQRAPARTRAQFY